MTKLKKFYLKYLLGILACVALLVVQAQGQLELPDRMSNIVTIGVQSGGNEDVIPEIISTETYEHLLVFLEDSTEFVHDYRYLTREDLTEAAAAKYPDFTEGYEYVPVSSENGERETRMATQLEMPLIIVNMIDSGNTGGNDYLEIPEGMDAYQMFALMPAAQKAEILGQIEENLSQMGESTLSIATSSAVLDIYVSLGADASSIQSNYVIDKGIEMLIVALVVSVATIAGGYFAAKVGAGVARDVRKAVFDKVAQFSQNEFHNFSTASLITRTTNDITQVQNVTVMLLRIALFAPIMGIMAIVKAINFAPSMTWIVWMVMVILLVVIGLMFAVVVPKFRLVQRLVDRLNLVMRENLSGILVIRAFGNEQVSKERFEAANKDLLDVNIFVNRVMVTMMPIMMFLFNVTVLLVIFFGSQQVDSGSIAIGQVMAFVQYAMMILMSFLMLGMIFFMVPRASVAARRISEVLETEIVVKDPITAKSFQNSERGKLEFNQVSYAYPHATEPVICDITFEANPGEVTAIIGSTGSGKTTLINLIPRLLEATSGSVKVNGIDVKEVSQHDLREVIGLVPQNAKLFSGTVKENLSYGNPEITDEELEEIIEISQAKEFLAGIEEGIEAPVSQGGTNFSGGQRQRLAIARALAKKADLYIFDDSFSALDFKTDATLRSRLGDMIAKTNSSILIVGQRIASIMNANQIIVLDEGRIVGKGTHDELMKDCQVYLEIAQSQLSKEELEHGR